MNMQAPVIAADAEATPIPSPEELVARAAAMRPMLREAGREAEELRKVPDHLIAACKEAGFFNIGKPKKFGGYEYEPGVQFEVNFELARGSASMAWVVALLGAHNWELGLCDPRIAEDIWGKDPDALISSSYASFGKAEACEGGYTVNGRWPWSSGSDHCQWAIVGTRHWDKTSPIGFHERAMYVAQGDYEVDQSSWHMAGMQGTGSKDVVVNNAFVPEYRNHCVTSDLFTGNNAGQGFYTAKTYKYPFGTIFGWTLASVIIGAAQGAIDVYTEAMNKKHNVYTGAESKRDPANQRRAADAAAIVFAAKSALRTLLVEMSEAIDTDGKASKERRAFYKWNAVFHARAAVDAIALLMKAGGGSAFSLDHELQRFFRDTAAASNHAFLSADRTGASYGWFMFSGQVEDVAI